MSTLRLLNLRRLREQPVRALLGVVAIAAGTALLVGVLIDRASLDRSLDAFVQQRAGAATIEIAGPGGPAGLDERVLEKVQDVQGVGTAVPLIQTLTIAEDAAGAERFVIVFGVDCTIEAVVGDFGCDQGQLDIAGAAFALSPSLADALGPDGVIRTSAGRMPLSNGFPIDELEGFNDGNIVAFTLPTAQDLFGFEGALGSILVVPEPGTDDAALRARLADAVGEHNIVGDPGMAGDADFASMLIGMLLLMSLFGLAIGAQLVHNTVALTLEERRRDLAVVGAIGAPPRTLLVGTLAEAGVLGVLGGLLGVLGGVLVAGPLVNGMSNTIDEVVGIRLSVHVPPSAVVSGIVLGLATSLFAAYGPARRASRMDVAAELHGQARRDETSTATRGRRAMAYVVLSIVGMALAWFGQRDGAIEPWQPLVAFGGFGLTAFLTFRAAQHGAAPLLASASRLPVLRDGAARVAIANLAGNPKRTGVMVLALSAAVGTGVVLSNINASIVGGSRQFGDSLAADEVLFVSTLDPNNTLGVAAKVSPPVLEQLRAIDGVGRVEEYLGFCGNHPSLDTFCVSMSGVDEDDFPVYRGRESIEEVFAHGEVAIGAALARSTGLRPGDEIEVPGRTGMHAFTVGAIWGDPDNTGRSIAVPRETFIEMYGDRPPSALYIEADGVSVDELERRIEAAALDPDLKVFDGRELADNFAEGIGGFVAPFTALQRAMLVVSLIAVTSTLLLVGVQRRREHGLLIAVGMAPAGLGRLVLTEAGIIGIAGSVLGTLSGLVTYVAMMWVSPLLTGLAAPFRFDLAAPVIYGGIGLVFVLLGAAVPAWRTSRLDPALALRYE